MFSPSDKTFLAHYARRLADLIIEQATELLVSSQLATPAASVSSMLFLSSNKECTVSNLASALGVTHQMATQRINQLITLKLVERYEDSVDKRAKRITLTAKGQKEVEHLKEFVNTMSHAFEHLENELACDLSNTIQRAELALKNLPLKGRLKND